MADDLRKVLMAGFGAVATAVEKTVGALSEATKSENRDRVRATVDDLAKRGEEAYEKSKAAGGELFAKIGDAFSGLKNVEVDDIKERLSDLADDALDDVERAVGEIKRWRAEKTAQASNPETAAPEAHPESGDKPEGAREEMQRAAEAQTNREDAEDLSEGTKRGE